MAGAGAGGGVAALLRTDDRPAAPRLARGSVSGGDGGPWRLVEPGGSIQDTIDGGALAIQLDAGEYPVPEPVRPTPGCTIRGVGSRTRLMATADIDAVIAVGAGGPVDSVVLADLAVHAQDRARVGIDLDIVGTSTNEQGEPDAMCRLDHLWVYEAAEDGIAYRGTDTQACVSTRIRVRLAGRHGYRVEAPDNVWMACEATTRGTEGAGFYIGTAIEGSDGIGAANNHFHACKAWYCHGVGWRVTAGRNAFVGCEAQDTAGHGWSIELARNSFTGCIADTAAMADVGGRPDEADGFFVEPDAETVLVGCVAFDRRPDDRQAQQRHGFNVAAALVEDGLLVAPTGWGNTGALVHRR